LIDAVPQTEEWQRANQPRRFSPSAGWMLEMFMVMKQRDEMATHTQSANHD
jgi:hypothetical protein